MRKRFSSRCFHTVDEWESWPEREGSHGRDDWPLKRARDWLDPNSGLLPSTQLLTIQFVWKLLHLVASDRKDLYKEAGVLCSKTVRDNRVPKRPERKNEMKEKRKEDEEFRETLTRSPTKLDAGAGYVFILCPFSIELKWEGDRWKCVLITPAEPRLFSAFKRTDLQPLPSNFGSKNNSCNKLLYHYVPLHFHSILVLLDRRIILRR